MHLLRNVAMPAAVFLVCSWAAAQDAETFSQPLRGADGSEIARISVSDGEIRYALQRPDGTWTDPVLADILEPELTGEPRTELDLDDASDWPERTELPL